MKDEEKNAKYLDPDESPLEKESPFDSFLDPSKSPLDGPDPPVGADADEYPLDLDDNEAIVSAYKSAFGEKVPNVNLEGTMIRLNENQVEVLVDSSWKPFSEIPTKLDFEVRRLISHFREKKDG